MESPDLAVLDRQHRQNRLVDGMEYVSNLSAAIVENVLEQCLQYGAIAADLALRVSEQLKDRVSHAAEQAAEQRKWTSDKAAEDGLDG